MSVRTFVVSVTTAPVRVVVEDIRNRRRAVAGDLAGVGDEIAGMLGDTDRAEAGGTRDQGEQEPCDAD